MPEDQNIPGENFKGQISNSTDHESDSIPQEQSFEESSTSNLEPQTKDMEVHHHPDLHHRKKHWKEYFLEFLMIFFAVTMGFFAENIRESITDHQREVQYIHSLVEDLNQDVKNINADIVNRNHKNEIADSLTQMMLSPNYQNQTSLIYFCARRFSIVGYVFHITDGTLMQLKNSGGLRLIQKQQVVDDLQNYYNIYQQHEDNRELDMLQLRDYRDIMVKIFNVRVFNEMIKNFPETTIPPGNPPLLVSDSLSINELLMRVELSKRINLVNIVYLNDLKSKALGLIEEMKKEYNIK